MKFCKVCGSTLDTIISTKQVGCAECYFTFQEEFVQSFKNLGISFGYKGALPRRIKGYRSKLIDRMTMQLKLEDAIASEEYEKAAFYRDYLKVLNQK